MAQRNFTFLLISLVFTAWFLSCTSPDESSSLTLDLGELAKDTAQYDSLQFFVKLENNLITEPSFRWKKGESLGSQVPVEPTSEDEFWIIIRGYKNDTLISERTLYSDGKEFLENVLRIPDANGDFKPARHLEIRESQGGKGKTFPFASSFPTHFADSTKITLYALPDKGYAFHSWTGDVISNDSQITFPITRDMEMTPVFHKKKYPVNLLVEGPGVVIYADSVITDSTEFSLGYLDTLRLNAKPQEGKVFSGWSGDFIGDQNSIEAEIDTGLIITAHFSEPNVIRLLTSVQPMDGGEVKVTPSKDSYDSNEVVTISAEADTGYAFVKWQGDNISSEQQVQLTMNQTKNVVAHFSKLVFLSVTHPGGQVEIEPKKSGYTQGENVTISAIADQNYRFQSWTGDKLSTESNISLQMDSNITLEANFIRQFNLEVEILGEGEVEFDPKKSVFDSGETVRLKAVPEPLYRFIDWGNKNKSLELNLVLEKNEKISANFQKIWESFTIPDSNNYSHSVSFAADSRSILYYSFNDLFFSVNGGESWEVAFFGDSLPIKRTYDLLQNLELFLDTHAITWFTKIIHLYGSSLPSNSEKYAITSFKKGNFDVIPASVYETDYSKLAAYQAYKGKNQRAFIASRDSTVLTNPTVKVDTGHYINDLIMVDDNHFFFFDSLSPTHIYKSTITTSVANYPWQTLEGDEISSLPFVTPESLFVVLKSGELRILKGINSLPDIIKRKIPGVHIDKLVMRNSKTGWALSESGRIYQTNNAFFHFNELTVPEPCNDLILSFDQRTLFCRTIENKMYANEIWLDLD